MRTVADVKEAMADGAHSIADRDCEFARCIRIGIKLDKLDPECRRLKVARRSAGISTSQK
jgi:hypothetical protein